MKGGTGGEDERDQVRKVRKKKEVSDCRFVKVEHIVSTFDYFVLKSVLFPSTLIHWELILVKHSLWLWEFSVFFTLCHSIKVLFFYTHLIILHPYSPFVWILMRKVTVNFSQ